MSMNNSSSKNLLKTQKIITEQFHFFEYPFFYTMTSFTHTLPMYNKELHYLTQIINKEKFCLKREKGGNVNLDMLTRKMN